MMKNTLYLFVAMVCFACKQQQQPHSQQLTDEQLYQQELDSMRFSYLDGIIMPFSRDVSDSNHLFFMSYSFFDTGYVFHIRKRGNEVRGVVYELSHGARNTTYDLSGERPELGFAYPFTGYGFFLNVKQWNEIMQRVNLIIKDSAAIRISFEKNQCTDGTPRELIFNGIDIEGTNCQDSIFENFTRYMKEQIVYKINE